MPKDDDQFIDIEELNKEKKEELGDYDLELYDEEED